MEAPVPASALIHSATLVSAGIYILVRYNALFVICDSIQSMFMLITSFTAFYGAIIASFQTDVKKILAYSTISHCGMLMFSITIHNPFVTIFYLFAHGFFKSINFMCVGNFIQASNNYQDTSKMGGFFSLLKFEFYFFAITLFNLSSGPRFFFFLYNHTVLCSAKKKKKTGLKYFNFK
jgi:NADH-quinone oxidoreductase subunit L